MSLYDDPITQQTSTEKQRQETAANFANDERNDFVFLMGTQQGRRMVWRILEAAGVFQEVFDGTNEGTIFAAGKRNIGLRLMDKIFDYCPDAFTLMMKEQHDDNREQPNPSTYSAD